MPCGSKIRVLGDGCAVRDIRILLEFLIASDTGKLKGLTVSGLHGLGCFRRLSNIVRLRGSRWSFDLGRLRCVSLLDGFRICIRFLMLVGFGIFRCVQWRLAVFGYGLLFWEM